MNEKEVTAYMESLSPGAIVHPGKEEMALEALQDLLLRMGSPERGLKYVHIAGTNGKGSILAYVSTVLQEAGYRVGRYFSPALHDNWEKIQVQQKPVPKTAIREGIALIAEHTAQMAAEGKCLPTVFEVETALAFWYFAKKACDIVVLECGLGGLTDATNVIPAPEVCVFAPIALDHMAILGKTIAEIATVKSGIMKPGADVVSAPQVAEAAKVLEKAAKKQGVTVNYAERPEKIRYGIKKQSFDTQVYAKLEITLAGVYQPDNAATAVAVLEQLRVRGWKIPEAKLRAGLAKTIWPGRFTILKERPYLIMDGAHNGAAAKVLRASLDQYFPDKPFVMILGVLRDKAYEELLDCLLERAVQVITLTPPDNVRALSAIELAETVQERGMSVTCADSVEEALELATLLSGKKFPILATGSLSWLGRLEKAVGK
ncbi:MAG: bifunctional folylpolyglutamate synthase/dihydrofolate synthase [Lachnospiraceae bacterium]|nr:bifunctional folylpolyglutamate synthase/dihydrofolate synthase [Lachnospiraceae bacterium]